MKLLLFSGLLVAAAAGVGLATAQGTAPAAGAPGTGTPDFTMVREMLADGNPAGLFEMRGEELWKTPAGPKNATLERCDLGLGPGVVRGASAQLPRFFADTNRVQDLESRLLTCRQQLQGIDPQGAIRERWGRGERADVVALATWVSGQSHGLPVKVVPTHPKEREALELGRQMFFFQAGTFDFSCANCHSVSGQRIRMTDLPDMTTPAGAAQGWTSWPAYRISNSQMWSMQHRLEDCFRQMRFPEPIYTSELTIALSYFLGYMSNGFEKVTPGVKR